jgi:hypothetical protein
MTNSSLNHGIGYLTIWPITHFTNSITCFTWKSKTKYVWITSQNCGMLTNVQKQKNIMESLQYFMTFFLCNYSKYGDDPNANLCSCQICWSNRAEWDRLRMHQTSQKWEMHTKFWSVNLRGRDHFGDLDIFGVAIHVCYLNKIPFLTQYKNIWNTIN